MLAAIPPMLPGAVLAMIGFLVIMVVVFSSGGVAKSKQFAVLGQLAAGEHGSGKRVGLFVGIALAVFGSCGAFAGVAASDADRRDACQAACAARGYEAGKIQGSTERDPPGSGKHAFVACVCTGGPDPDPLEFPASDLANHAQAR